MRLGRASVATFLVLLTTVLSGCGGGGGCVDVFPTPDYDF